jgi:predicted solute-binding protein
MISKELEEGVIDIALIPALDLLNHKELFVSKKIALSFDGELSNSYLYFKPDINNFERVYLAGDVSSNEAILVKILFAERYNSKVEVTLESKDLDLKSHNYLLCGNENFESRYFNRGVSFSDQIASMIDYPYTNYVLAARDEDAIDNFVKTLPELDKYIEDNLKSFLGKLNYSPEITEFVNEEFSSIYYELTSNEIDGLTELFKLPYYHGIAEEMIDIKLV